MHTYILHIYICTYICIYIVSISGLKCAWKHKYLQFLFVLVVVVVVSYNLRWAHYILKLRAKHFNIQCKYCMVYNLLKERHTGPCSQFHKPQVGSFYSRVYNYKPGVGCHWIHRVIMVHEMQAYVGGLDIKDKLITCTIILVICLQCTSVNVESVHEIQLMWWRYHVKERKINTPTLYFTYLYMKIIPCTCVGVEPSHVKWRDWEQGRQNHTSTGIKVLSH